MNLKMKNLLRIGACVFLLYLCIYYWPAVSGIIKTALGATAPILIGAAIAYVLNILMMFYERHYFKKSSKKWADKTRRPLCLVGAVITLLAIVTAVVWLIAPKLTTCVALIVSEIPPAVEKLLKSEFLATVLPESTLSALSNVNWNEFISKAVEIVASGIGSATSAIMSVVGSVVSVVATAFVSIIFSIYFLLSKERLLSAFSRVLHNYFGKCEQKILYLGRALNENLHKFIVGQCTEALILGALCTVGMLIFGFPYATMVGAFIGFTALIPIAGAYIGAGVGAFIIFTESPIKALLFIVFIIVLQNLEGNLIYPKVVGNSIGLPAIFVLAAITIGGGLFGILGMLLGVPVMATIYRLVREDIARKEAPKVMENGNGNK